MVYKRMDINEINKLPIPSYMEAMGYHPKRTSGGTLTYIAEWRGGDGKNVTVKFKNDKWVWKDHSGKSNPSKGDIIDLCMAIHGCSKHEACLMLTEWAGGGTIQVPEYVTAISKEKRAGTQVVEEKRITHDALKYYLKDRCISLRTAQRYCKEIHLYFPSTEKTGFFIGFPNIAGGYTFRNKYMKGSTKQDISLVAVKDSTVYRVFEGFFDFLSFVEINGEPYTNCIILNSVENFDKASDTLSSATSIVLMLDNDDAGRLCSLKFREKYGDIVVDKSHEFAPYNDLNEYLVKDRSKSITKKTYYTEILQDPNAPNEYHIKIPSILIEERKNHAPKDNIYLGEFMQELPMNCVFLKGATGCGATTLALSDTHNSIVAMPTRATVESKWLKRDMNDPTNESKFSYRTDIFPLYGGKYENEFQSLKEYLDDCDMSGMPIKIVCTYDQVEKVFMWLSGKTFDKETKSYRQNNSHSYLNRDVRSFRLYIDEIHQCYKDWATDSRRRSIRGMLRCVSEFNEVCFITATPMKREHFFPEMRNLNIFYVDYNVKMPEPVIETAGYIKNAVANKIVAHLNGEIAGNAHFFVNSVNFIKDVIAKLNKKGHYKDGLFRVVCGDTERNRTKIREAIRGAKGGEIVEKMAHAIGESENLPVRSINSPVAKINFYTSTAFQGADIFDTTARVYIVSDTANVFTMVNVENDYKQIVGRVRDAFNNIVTHIVNPKGSRYWSKDKKGLNQYEQDKKARLEESQFLMSANPELLRKLMATEDDRQKFKAQWYLLENEDTGEIYQDEVLEWLDDDNNENMLNYQSPATIKASLLAQNINASIGEMANDEWEDAKKERQNFKKNFLRYANEMRRTATLFEENPKSRQEVENIRRKDPLVADAYDLLGEDKVRQLQYKRGAIKTEVRVAKILRKKGSLIKVMKQHCGKSYTSAEMDAVCTELQTMFRLERKPKFSEYFHLKPTTKRDKESGKHVKAQRIEGLKDQ